LRDYFTYVGMVLFCLGLWLAKRPLEWMERISGRPLRERAIAWIGRLAKA
jgi:hypothetical protein